ncbi:hypothetical protein GCM10007216_34700 [Thalassobacillus devorans]|uniref:Uncharacterized protein n=1 Tax=Thalassobacillus devorans TaxID=279813 RepID=A0ABQ1PQ47_9BACI|nr:hypothetical protein [Thalassobacillus devorans]NIK30343.1 hypothetical protein [Thalassobacillus devorans]GGD01025.1 hypothetical protein GCM10007216_34700 [Thalassobacillus devorans]
MSKESKQTEQHKKETTIDMEGIWKAASVLLKNDAMVNALSELKQLDFTTSDLNMNGILKKYSEETSNKLEELKAQMGGMNKQLEELKAKVDEVKNLYIDEQKR